ncbi:hypothetical protein GN956_G26123 [Arapaima gigas]
MCFFTPAAAKTRASRSGEEWAIKTTHSPCNRRPCKLRTRWPLLQPCTNLEGSQLSPSTSSSFVSGSRRATSPH